MKKRSIALLLAVVLVMGVLAGCGKSENEGEKRVFRIGTTQVYTTALTSIAVAKGYVEECLPEGVTLEFSKLASGPDCRDALIAEKIDLCDMATMTYMTALENDLPISVVCGTGKTPIYLYSCKDNVTDVSDFTETSRIAITNKVTTLHAAFLATCKEEMGDALKYDNCLVPIPAADALATLSGENDFDGAIFSFPNKVKADKLENLTLMKDMTDVINKYGDGGVMIVRNSYLDQNRDITDAYIESLKKAKVFVESNPQEAAEILSEVYGVEAEYIVEAFKAMPPNYIVDSYNELGSLLYEAGVLKNQPKKFEELNNYENIPQE